MLRNEHVPYRSLGRLSVIALAALLGVLVIASLAPAAPKKDDTASQVYQHTYDEVFQASQEAMERMGMFADAKDKDKGTISGHGNYTVNGGLDGRSLLSSFTSKPSTLNLRHD